jgi:O-antigen/teichoic acid export membrane protein
VRKPPELAVRIGFNGLAQLAPVLVVLALTPLLLDRLGLDRFGIWSLTLVVLNTLRLLDGGIAASMARFFAIHAARADRIETGRLLAGALLALALLGAALTAVAFALAPSLVGLLDVPDALETEGAALLRWAPALAALALMGESAAALLVGNGRFQALAAAMWSSAAAYALGLVLLTQPDASLELLAVASAGRYVVLLGASVLLGARHAHFGWPLLPSLASAREVGAYAWRMQLSSLTGFVNTELDALVIAALLPVRYVGLYQIGLQVASAVRSLPLYAFAPLLTRLTMLFRREGRGATRAQFDELERRWMPAVSGYGLVAVAAVGFSVTIWLGDDYALSGGVAAVLLAGYTAHVVLTGMRTCYVRAVGRPGLETRCSTMWTALNLLLTVPLGLLGGVLGVVAATATAGIVASIYFVRLCRRAEELPFMLPAARVRWTILVAVVVTALGELALLQTGVGGTGGLALSAVPALLGWALVAAGLREQLTATFRPSPRLER